MSSASTGGILNEKRKHVAEPTERRCVFGAGGGGSRCRLRRGLRAYGEALCLRRILELAHGQHDGVAEPTERRYIFGHRDSGQGP